MTFSVSRALDIKNQSTIRLSAYIHLWKKTAELTSTIRLSACSFVKEDSWTHLHHQAVCIYSFVKEDSWTHLHHQAVCIYSFVKEDSWTHLHHQAVCIYSFVKEDSWTHLHHQAVCIYSFVKEDSWTHLHHQAVCIFICERRQLNSPEPHVDSQDLLGVVCGQFICVIRINNFLREWNTHHLVQSPQSLISVLQKNQWDQNQFTSWLRFLRRLRKCLK